ncbi:MAG TPA: hypothetical protein VF263_21555, partial [Longimicrobiaceae bacterium]
MAKAHTLVDNFNDNSTDTAKWIAQFDPAPVGERIREVNQRVEIRPPSGASGLGKYLSATTYDLTNSEFSVEIVRPLSPDPLTQMYLRAEIDSGNRITTLISEGSVIAYQAVGGAVTELARVRHDPAVHRWLRLRHSAGVLYWEYSADGMDWRVLYSKAPPISLTAVTLQFGAGVGGSGIASPGVAVYDNFNVPATALSRRVEQRRLSARDVRVEAADLAASRPHDEHVNNNDEVNYPTFTGRELAGLYSKSLRHDSFGDPDPFSYDSLLRALQSEDPADFEEIVLGSNTAVKLTNPQGGLAFDVAGPDAQEITQPPAPRFDSEETAHEAGELYWMAVARDVHFGNYATDPVISAAVTSLNGEFPRFGGTVPVTAQNVFRGIFEGEQVGPYVSQFLWKGNTDPRKPDGLGRDANEGYVSYGAQVIDQRIVPQ